MYSGTVDKALPWTWTLMAIKRRIEAVLGRHNYCLVNRYRSGTDSAGLHADNEPGIANMIGYLSHVIAFSFRNTLRAR